MARKSRKQRDAAPNSRCGEDSKLIYNVGAYIRLSVFDKKQKGDSIETQQAIIDTFIAEHPDMELRETYIDNGLSGQSFERPAFQQMIADMECGKINCCAVKDLSRLGRNAIDTGYYIEKYFPSNNVRFVAVNDNYDSADGQSGGIMLSLKNMVNEAYALDIGRKIRATKQMNIQNGCFVGRFPPYGYLKDPKDNHKLIPDPDAASIVQKMFEMAANGIGVSAIAKWLNESGILPPKRYFHSKGLATEKEVNGQIHWNKAVIYALLKNRVYCGDMVQGKYKTHSYAQEKLPESEWVVTENTHDGIISRELFAEVQKLWEKSSEPKKSQYCDPKTENIFVRKIFCGHCGRTMHRTRTSKTQYNFKCSTQLMYDKSDCRLVSINENLLKEKLLETLRKQNLDFEKCEPVSNAENSVGSELRDVQTELDKNRGFFKGLYESLVNGDINDAEYKEMKSVYEMRISALAERKKQLRQATHDRIRQESECAKVSESMGALRHISDLTSDTVDRLIEKILVFEDKHIEVKFRFGEVAEYE